MWDLNRNRVVPLPRLASYSRLRLAEESRSAIKEEIDELEKLEQEDIDTLMGMIKGLHGTLRKQQDEENHQFSIPSDGKDKQAGPEAVR